MPLIDRHDPVRHYGAHGQLLIGPRDGARTLFRLREHYPAGTQVGLHTHQGDESFEVCAGELRFSIAGERHVGQAGDILCVPPGTIHGFVALTAAELEIFSQQQMGIWVVVRFPDGRQEQQEIFIKDSLWSREPPPGQRYTPPAQARALFRTTYHLL